jgi:hypothetical protein
VSAPKSRSPQRSARLARQREWWAQEQKAIDPAEIVNGTAPLTETKAKQLDGRIQRMVDATVTHMDKLLALLEEAATGQIWGALGFPSWPAYVKNRVQGKISPTDREERKALVELMSGRGMSQRAIAGAVGVSQKTVDRDLATESNDSVDAEVISLDGKRRPKHPKPKPTQPAISDGHDGLRSNMPSPAQRQTPKAEPETVGDIDHDVRTIVSEINDAARDMARHANTVSWMRTTGHFRDEHGEQIATAAETLMDAVLDVMAAAKPSDTAP